MAFTQKNWADTPGTATPLSAAAMEDLEMRTTDYVETVSPGVNVWESVANGGTVTDWGAIINSHLTDGARHLVLDEHDFPFTTPLNMESNTLVEGAGGFDWLSDRTPKTQLVWKGAGAGTAVDCSNTGGVAFKNLAIRYDNASFSGTLVNMDDTGGNTMEDCALAASPVTLRSASRLITLHAIGNYFERVYFYGAQTLVRGYNTTLQTDSNTITFRDCIYGMYTDFAIANPGFDWLFDGCIWEIGSGAVAAPNNVGIGCDLASQMQSSRFTVQGQCSFWDADIQTQKAIEQPVGIPWDVKIRDSSFYDNQDVPNLDFQGTGSLDIRSCHIEPSVGGTATIDLGDVDVNGADSRKTGIVIENVPQLGGYNAIDNPLGHAQVEIQGLGASPMQFRTVTGYERAGAIGAVQRPSVAVHGGYSAPGGFVSETHGTDAAGVIRFNTVNGAAPAGTAIDLTFGTALAPDYRTGGYKTWLSVQLTPIAVDTLAPDGAAITTAGPYAVIANSSTDPMVSSTGFSIAFANEVPQDSQFAISYRVMQL